MVKGSIIILTGGRGSGKTTFCQRLVEDTETIGFKTAGVLSPPVLKDGLKTGIDIVDLATKKRRCLATYSAVREAGSPTPGWEFVKESLAWGNTVLDTDIDPDLLIVDELGPMELVYHKGWTNGIKAINRGLYQLAIVVIRPELLAIGQKRWSRAELLEITPATDLENRRAGILQHYFKTPGTNSAGPC